MVAPDVTLFRQSVTTWPGGEMVHVLDHQYSFMLVAPMPCKAVLADVLAEKATVLREALVTRRPEELTRRGYCRHCVDTLR